MGRWRTPLLSITAAIGFVLAKKSVVRNLIKNVDLLKNSTIWLSGANVEAKEM